MSGLCPGLPCTLPPLTGIPIPPRPSTIVSTMHIRVAAASLTLFACGAAIALQAQSPATFEVASVKESNPKPGGPLAAIPMFMPPVGGRFTATNVPLRLLIRLAYGVQDFQVVGGPDWQTTKKFDIDARAENTAASMTDVAPMLKSLLAERFALKTHTESRELPIYALVVAGKDGKLGPALKLSSSDCSQAQAEAQKLADALARGGPAAAAALLPRPGEKRTCTIMPAGSSLADFGLRADGQPIAILVQLLTQATGRLVQDKTGLTGLYDFELKFDPEVLLRMASSQAGINIPLPNLPPSDSPSMMTALQEQLGLRLDSQRAPVDVLVIDSAELPSAN